MLKNFLRNYRRPLASVPPSFNVFLPATPGFFTPATIPSRRPPRSMNSSRRGDVSLLDLANYQDPLDVLRRFTPTPLRTRFCLAAATVVVETNDFSLLPALP